MQGWWRGGQEGRSRERLPFGARAAACRWPVSCPELAPAVPVPAQPARLHSCGPGQPALRSAARTAPCPSHPSQPASPPASQPALPLTRGDERHKLGVDELHLVDLLGHKVGEDLVGNGLRLLDGGALANLVVGCGRVCGAARRGGAGQTEWSARAGEEPRSTSHAQAELTKCCTPVCKSACPRHRLSWPAASSECLHAPRPPPPARCRAHPQSRTAACA